MSSHSMRTAAAATALSLGFALVLSAQVRPPAGVVDDAERRAQEHALLSSQALAERSRGVMGSLNAGDNQTFRRWDRVVQAWKKENGTDVGARLSEGVLFDCLSRLHGILTVVLGSEEARPYFLDLAAARPSRASKAFQAALKIDPDLTEARFRDARIRADKDLDARLRLEQLSEGTGVIAYLAAMSRAETARVLKDSAGVERWYKRAASILPGAPAPRVGLAAVTPGTAVPFDTLDRSDPYYSYPCVVLTAPVDAELSRRIHGENNR